MDISLTVRFCLFFRILICILIYFVPFIEFCFGGGVPESFVEVTASAFPFEGSCKRVSDSDKLYLINNIALIIHLVYLSDIQNGVHNPGVDALSSSLVIQPVFRRPFHKREHFIVKSCSNQTMVLAKEL